MSIGTPIIKYGSLESTNKEAAELLNLSKVQHGAVILAREQTAGRGQRGRSWTSVAGEDLMCSVVLKPGGMRVDEQFQLSKVAALAVSDAIMKLVPHAVRIKWPNDILVGRNKVAGILIKNEVVGELVQSCIVGIGINVNSSGFPEDLVATSVYKETGRAVDLDHMLIHVCTAMDQRWNDWIKDRTCLDQPYQVRLWARGRWAEFVLDDRPVMARPLDVDGLGRLIVEEEGGGTAAYGLDRLRFAPR